MEASNYKGMFMKFILLLSSLLFLTNCSSGSSGSDQQASPMPPSNGNFTNQYNQIPVGAVLQSSTSCFSYNNPNTVVEGNFYKLTIHKGSSSSWDLVVENFSTNDCSGNSLMTIAWLKDVNSVDTTSSTSNTLNLSLFDVQYNIKSQSVLDVYNSVPMFGKSWLLNQLESVINLKATPQDTGPTHIKNTLSTTIIQVFPNSKRVLVGNVEFFYQ